MALFLNDNSSNFTTPTSEKCESLSEAYRTEFNDWTTKPSVQVCFGLLYFCIFVVGTTSNIFVIMSVAQRKSLQTVRNLFIVNLSFSDIIVCLTSTIITPVSAVAKNWIFGQVMCHAFPLVQGMSIFISTLTLTCIAIDRYILIVHPSSPPLYRQQALVLIFSVWFAAITAAAPAAIFNQYITFRNYCGKVCMESWPDGPYQRAYGTTLLFVQFILPFVCMGYCYARICVRLTKQFRLRKSCCTHYEAALRRKRRTNRMLILMCVLFAVCWLPQVVQTLLRDIGETPNFIMRQYLFWHLVSHVIAMTSTVWNPMLYAWFNVDFRNALFDLLPRKCVNRAHRNIVRDTAVAERKFAAESMPLQAKNAKKKSILVTINEGNMEEDFTLCENPFFAAAHKHLEELRYEQVYISSSGDPTIHKSTGGGTYSSRSPSLGDRRPSCRKIMVEKLEGERISRGASCVY